jgi:uncharacterized delta-60 repeat protein
MPNKKIFVKIFSLALFFSLTIFFLIKAAPPNTPYLPGETLDPNCAPGETNCTVYPPAISTRQIQTTLPLTGGGDLSQDRTLSLIGLSGLGSAHQVLGVKSDATGLEYKNITSLLTAGSGISISGTATATISNIGVLSLNSLTGNINLQGTTNQINVATSSGTIILSLPQDIALTSSPTFSGLTIDTNTLYVDNINHRLGIGTTTPAYKLDVFGGDIRATGYLRGETGLCIGSDCKTSWPTGGGETHWVLSGNYLYASSTVWNVGIGTTTAPEKLTVQGNILATGNLTIQGESSLATTTISTQLAVPKIVTLAGNLTIDPAGNLVISKSTSILGDLSVSGIVTTTQLSVTSTSTLGTVISGIWQGFVIETAYGGTGLSSLGSANQILGVNSGATGLEYKNITSLLSAGSGISISGTATATISNTGILSLTAGPGISISSGQNPTISNIGVLSLNSATGTLTLQGTTNQINVATNAGTITLSLPQDIATTSSPTFSGLTLSSLTSGSVLFAGSGGTISQDNSNLFWDNTNKRLGIGTTAPSYKLTVSGGDIYGSNNLYIAGNVGIGTTDPLGYKLRVEGGDVLIGNGTTDPSIMFKGRSGDNHAAIRWATNDLTTQKVVLGVYGDNAWFYPVGNVGIGTTAPEANLHIRGTTSANNIIQTWGASGASGDYSTLQLIKTADTNGNFIFRTFDAGGAAPNPKIAFGKYAANPWDGAQMVLDTDTGNVGIGTTNPGSRLEVRGSTSDSSASALNITNSGGTSLLYVRNDGNVGIGTTDVTAKLTIQNLNNDQASLLIKQTGPLFQKTIGGTNADYGYSIQQTSDGGYVITGYTQSFGAGYSDIFVIKLDSSGNLSWAKTIGGTDYESGYSIQQTSDGGYVITGGTRGFGAGGTDVFVIKLDSSGNLSWAKTIGGTNSDYGNSIQQTSDGGYVITGYTQSFGAGNGDVFVIKLDSSGNLSWAKTIGGTNSDYGNSIQQTSDGGYVITGYTQSFGAGYSDIFVIKLDSSGNLSWARTIGGTSDDEGSSIQQTSDGGYVITGYTQSFGAGGDVFVIKLDSSGNLSWAKTIGGTSYDYGNSIQQTSDGGYVITGYTSSFGAGSYDVFVIKLNSSGNLSWAKTIGGTSDDAGYSIQQTSDGGYVITGRTGSFGAGNYDVFVIKLDSSGNIPGCSSIGSPSPSVSSPSPTVNSPSPSVSSPSPTVGSPSPTVSSQSPSTPSQCSANFNFTPLVLTPEGRLGVGVTSTQYQLEVAGKIKATQICLGSQCYSSIPEVLWQKSGNNIVYNAGNVGIGTTAPDVKLDVAGDIEAGLTTTGSTVAVYAITGGSNGGTYKLVRYSSSQRYKENITDFNLGLETVLKLQPREFTWKSTGERDFGFIAEEAEKVNPFLITYLNGQPEAFRYSQYTAILTNAIKEQQKEIEELKLAINQNETKIDPQLLNSLIEAISKSENEDTSLFDNFVSTIKKSLEKLGLFIENGIAKLKEIFAEKVTTKQICFEGDDGETICVDKNQLKQLLQQTNNSQPTTDNSQPTPTPTEEATPSPTPETTPTEQPTPSPSPSSTPEPTSTPPSS